MPNPLALPALRALRGGSAVRTPSGFALALLLAACGGGTAADVPTPPDGDGAALDYEVVATGLVVPWDLGFAPDGRVFVTERPGRVRVIEDGRLRAQPWATLDVAAEGEAGLTAIAVPPDFDADPAVYVLGTFGGAGGLENRVVRIPERGGSGGTPEVIVDGLPADRIHAGSALEFGPDGLLWVTAGDAAEPRFVQEEGAWHGKVLRFRRDGAPAPDNPLAGAVWALGMRNPQGLAWNEAGALFATEHGPSGLPWEGGRSGHDELNHVVAGGNYGWPEIAGSGGGDAHVQPLAVWQSAIAPSGLAIYTGDDIPDWRGDAFLGALRGRHLRRVELTRAGDGWRAGDQQELFGELGRIRAVVMGPDGALWFTTSNRDGRGNPAGQDDRVLRLVRR